MRPPTVPSGCQTIKGSVAWTGKPGLPAFSSPPNKSSRRIPSSVTSPSPPDGSLWAVTTKGVRRFDSAGQWAAPAAIETGAGEIFTPKEGLSSGCRLEGADRSGGSPGSRRIPASTGFGATCLPGCRFRVLKSVSSVSPREIGVPSGLEVAACRSLSVAADGKMTVFQKTGQTTCVRRDQQWHHLVGRRGRFSSLALHGLGFSPAPYPDENLDAVVSIAVDRNNDPWITTRSGRAYRFSNGTWNNQNQALGKKPGVIGAMADDPGGKYLVCLFRQGGAMGRQSPTTHLSATRKVSPRLRCRSAAITSGSGGRAASNCSRRATSHDADGKITNCPAGCPVSWRRRPATCGRTDSRALPMSLPPS